MITAPALLRYYLENGKQNPMLSQPTLVQQLHAYYTHWVQMNYHQRDFVVAMEHVATMLYIEGVYAGQIGQDEHVPSFNPLPMAELQKNPTLSSPTRFFDDLGFLSHAVDTSLCSTFLPREFCIWLKKGGHGRDFIQAVKDLAAVEVQRHCQARSLCGLGGEMTADQFLTQPLRIAVKPAASSPVKQKEIMKKIDYVLVIILDPFSGYVVGLTKKKGPAFLLNKLTFPGGKLEAGETALVAAQRETLEETGLDLPLESFSVFEEADSPEYSLTKVVVLTNKVFFARTMEEEPIWHLDCKYHLRECQFKPDQYAPDFHATLMAALSWRPATQVVIEA
jgi:8-oxo-dGTP pyrophosphatase MutT (NUDIX family)